MDLYESPSRGDGEPSSKRKNILILDDDKELLETLLQRLENEGFNVTCASSGADGVQKIMSEDFDAVVCDMVMPNMAGDMFFQVVERAKPELAKRFVFITGHADDANIDGFIRRVDGKILLKPFGHKELQDAIEEVIERKEVN